MNKFNKKAHWYMNGPILSSFLGAFCGFWLFFTLYMFNIGNIGGVITTGAFCILLPICQFVYQLHSDK